MKLPQIKNPIQTFAVLCVAVIAAYVMVVGWRLISILSSPDWCVRALGAEKASAVRTIEGLKACISLMDRQVRALAVDSHISQGVVALCLAVLIVLVIAGGRLSLKGSKDGVEANIGKDVGEAAEAVAVAAVDKAEEIKDEAKP